MTTADTAPPASPWGTPAPAPAPAAPTAPAGNLFAENTTPEAPAFGDVFADPATPTPEAPTPDAAPAAPAFDNVFAPATQNEAPAFDDVFAAPAADQDSTPAPAPFGDVFPATAAPAGEPAPEAPAFGDVFTAPQTAPEAPAFGDLFGAPAASEDVTAQEPQQPAEPQGFGDMFPSAPAAPAATPAAAPPAFGDLFTPSAAETPAPATAGPSLSSLLSSAPQPAAAPSPTSETPAETPPQAPPTDATDLLATLQDSRRAPATTTTPSVAAHAGGDCPACAVINGTSATVITRTDTVLAYLDDNPASTGHTVVLPTAHHAHLANLTTGQTVDVAATISALHTALAKSSIPTSNTTTLIRTNDHGHLTIDIIPTTTGDTITVINDRRRRDRAELDLVGAEITNHLS